MSLESTETNKATVTRKSCEWVWTHREYMIQYICDGLVLLAVVANTPDPLSRFNMLSSLQREHTLVLQVKTIKVNPRLWLGPYTRTE